MTEKVFYQNQYTRGMDVTIQEVRKGKKAWEIICDKTIFYPEGGGQPGDRGRIGEAEVHTTRKDGNEVVHLTKKQPDFEPGQKQRMVLDWDHRFDYMQQHSGQHILSAVFYRELGIGTVSVHQGEEYTTIELDCEDLSDEQIEAAEEQANTLVTRNVPLTDEVVEEDAAAEMDLRREPKVGGEIRIVELEHYDKVACGGVHVGKSGEVGWIACIGTEKIRGHVRTVWKIGKRAVRDYRMKTRVLDEAGTLLSASPEKTPDAVRKQQDKLKELQSQLELERSKLARSYAQQAEEHAEMLPNGIRFISAILHDEDPKILKTVFENLQSEEEERNNSDDMKNVPNSQHNLVYCGLAVCSEDLRWLIGIAGEVPLDFGKVRTELFPLVEAKGGGKAPIWQGMGKAPGGRREFIAALKKTLKELK